MSRVVQDVMCLSIPEEIDPTLYLPDPGLRAAFLTKLTQLAHQTVWAQWPTEKPAVEIEELDWMVTQAIADIEAFQPAHDCADCWMGNLKAEAFLKEHPGRWIAMANITYTVTER